jgi:N-methylhydantoinase A
LSKSAVGGCGQRSERSLDLRYGGQGYELNVPASGNYTARFHRAHKERYGYADEQRPVEVVNARVRLIARTTPVPLRKKTLRKATGRQAIVSRRHVVFGDSHCETPVYDRALLRAGDAFSGPGMITEYSATTLIPLGCRARVDAWENILVEVSRAIR